MVKIEYAGNYNIDEHSQRILLELADRQEPLGTGDLTEPAGFDRTDYDRVRYRMKNKLTPAGLTRELEPEQRWDTNRLRFEITNDGLEFVDDHREQLGALRDISEIALDAREAKTDAESAKNSVQGYRQKVGRTKGKVDDLDDAVDDIQDDLENLYAGFHDLQERLHTQKEVESLEETVDEFSDTVTELKEKQIENKTSISRAPNSEEVADLRKRVKALESDIRELKQYLKAREEKQGNSSSILGGVKWALSGLRSGLGKLRRSRKQPYGRRRRWSWRGLFNKLFFLLFFLVAIGVFTLSGWIIFQAVQQMP